MLTHAKIEPTGRFEGFNPCGGCTLCAKICPARAIDPRKVPPTGYDREVCFEFYRFLREKGYARFCGLCYVKCPTGVKKDIKMAVSKKLEDLSDEAREGTLASWLALRQAKPYTGVCSTRPRSL